MEERHISYSVSCEVIDEVIVVPVCHVVQILHAHYVRNPLTLSKLLGTDVTKTGVFVISASALWALLAQQARRGLGLLWIHCKASTTFSESETPP